MNLYHPRDLTEKLRAMTDRDLLSIAGNVDEFRPEVRAIAREILFSRGVAVPPEEVPLESLGKSLRSGSFRFSDRSDDGPRPPRDPRTPPPDYTQLTGGLGFEEAETSAQELRREGIPFFVDRDLVFWVPKELEERARAIFERAGLVPELPTFPPVGEEGGECPACGTWIPVGATECPACRLVIG